MANTSGLTRGQFFQRVLGGLAALVPAALVGRRSAISGKQKFDHLMSFDVETKPRHNYAIMRYERFYLHKDCFALTCESYERGLEKDWLTARSEQNAL